jgi:hypothetical protein
MATRTGLAGQATTIVGAAQNNTSSLFQWFCGLFTGGGESAGPMTASALHTACELL